MIQTIYRLSQRYVRSQKLRNPFTSSVGTSRQKANHENRILEKRDRVDQQPPTPPSANRSRPGAACHPERSEDLAAKDLAARISQRRISQRRGHNHRRPPPLTVRGPVRRVILSAAGISQRRGTAVDVLRHAQPDLRLQIPIVFTTSIHLTTWPVMAYPKRRPLSFVFWASTSRYSRAARKLHPLSRKGLAVRQQALFRSPESETSAKNPPALPLPEPRRPARPVETAGETPAPTPSPMPSPDTSRSSGPSPRNAPRPPESPAPPPPRKSAWRCSPPSGWRRSDKAARPVLASTATAASLRSRIMR